MSDIPTTGQIRTGNPSVVGGVDKSQNVLSFYLPFSLYLTIISFKETNSTSFARMGIKEVHH